MKNKKIFFSEHPQGLDFFWTKTFANQYKNTKGYFCVDLTYMEFTATSDTSKVPSRSFKQIH